MSNRSKDTTAPGDSSMQLKGERLLVVSPVSFTEACFLVPAIRALKRYRPAMVIVVLCPVSIRSLWQPLLEVDDVIVYPDSSSARKIARQLNESPLSMDSAILWAPDAAAKATARVGIPQRIGYPVKGLVKLLTDPVDRVVVPGPIEHRVRYYLALVEKLGCDAFVRENFKPAELPQAPEKIRIALAQTSEYGPSYQWPEDKLNQLKVTMEERHGAIEWVDVSGDGNIAEVLASCSALVASDGEVAHWAAHIGLPAVVIFGPGEPDWMRPLGKQSKVVRERAACSPCYLSKCPLDHRCLNEIGVDDVALALEGALTERSG